MTKLHLNNPTGGRLALLTAAVIWGSSFIVMKDAVAGVPVFLLLAIRFSIACALLGVIFRKRLKASGRTLLGHGAVCGVLLLSAYATQTFGLTTTSPGTNAFLTAVYCVLVPFVMWLMFRKRPTVWNWAAAALCLTGVGLVSLTGDMTITPGDAWTLLGGLFFALHMVAVSRFGEHDDPVVLTVWQFAASAVCCWVMTFAAEGMPQPIPQHALFGVIYLSLFATAAALLLQNVGQSMASAASASILLSLESVFGVIDRKSVV